jgi:phosphoglycolate phosphatase
LARYFDFVAGSEMDGSRVEKADVIAYALEARKIEPSPDCVMVGDRLHDVIGARANNLACIGVAYGYGGAGELKEAGAACIAESVGSLRELLLR